VGVLEFSLAKARAVSGLRRPTSGFRRGPAASRGGDFPTPNRRRIVSAGRRRPAV